METLIFLAYAVICPASAELGDLSDCNKIYNSIQFEDEAQCVLFLSGPGYTSLMMYLDRAPEPYVVDEIGCEPLGDLT